MRICLKWNEEKVPFPIVAPLRYFPNVFGFASAFLRISIIVFEQKPLLSLCAETNVCDLLAFPARSGVRWLASSLRCSLWRLFCCGECVKRCECSFGEIVYDEGESMERKGMKEE